MMLLQGHELTVVNGTKSAALGKKIPKFKKNILYTLVAEKKLKSWWWYHDENIQYHDFVMNSSRGWE